MARPSNTAERRLQIARALLRVMAKSGYDGATIADVAKVARIAPGLVHYHFKNKLEILLVAIDELGHDYDARLARHLQASAGDPASELGAFVDAHLHVGRDAEPAALACWIEISAEALRTPRVKAAFAAILTRSAAALRAIIERGCRLRVFGCDDPLAAAAAIVATIQGYFVLAATARELIPRGSAAVSTLRMCEGLLSAKGPLRGRS